MATGGGGTASPETSKLECGICLERYRRPKLLLCFHTFCQACLQALAGDSSSLACPACRTVVVLPPGGVGALQTNFYIDEDLDNDPTNAKLCDVCAERREATVKCLQCKQRYCLPCRHYHDSFTFGRSHTIISLQTHLEDNADLKDKLSVQNREEKCLKHPKHELILYCNSCKTNICLQCKLTSHEGHPTDDLEDAEAKVKAKVQNLLESIDQHILALDRVLVTADLESKRLQDLEKKTEEDIRKRGETLVQWSAQAVDTAVEKVRSTTEHEISSLHARTQHVRDQRAAATAQRDHVTRVLDSDVIADIVSMEAQLSELSIDRNQLLQLQASLQRDIKNITCKHDPRAVSLSDMMAFVGTLEKGPSADEQMRVSSAAGNTQISEEPQIAVCSSQDDQNCLAQGKEAEKKPRQFTYSRNPKSVICDLCPTSENRLWVRYSPSGTGLRMDLYSESGEFMESGQKVTSRGRAMTVLTDITIYSDLIWCGEKKLHWFQPGGTEGETTADTNFSDPSKTLGGNGHVVGLCDAALAGISYHVISFQSFSPLKWRKEASYGKLDGILLDASFNRQYCAFRVEDCLKVYRKPLSDNKFRIDSVYNLPKGGYPKDACFCLIDGRELLVVAFNVANALHVVDHTDGCLFVRYLNTEPYTLDRPCCLATDYTHRLWIGCDGGKVVLVYL